MGRGMLGKGSSKVTLKVFGLWGIYPPQLIGKIIATYKVATDSECRILSGWLSVDYEGLSPVLDVTLLPPPPASPVPRRLPAANRVVLCACAFFWYSSV